MYVEIVDFPTFYPIHFKSVPFQDETEMYTALPKQI